MTCGGLSVPGQTLRMNLRVTRSKVLRSSGFGRTWQVSRFNLAGGRLIWRGDADAHVSMSWRAGHIPEDTLIWMWMLGGSVDHFSSPCCGKLSGSQISLHTSSSAKPSWSWGLTRQKGRGKKKRARKDYSDCIHKQLTWHHPEWVMCRRVIALHNGDLHTQCWPSRRPLTAPHSSFHYRDWISSNGWEHLLLSQRPEGTTSPLLIIL